MAQREGEVENLAHAYRVLNVAWDAPPRAIKASYRKLVKRWHPDRHPPGTPAHTESTLMTSLLNESYARIADAPLRAGHATPFSSASRSASAARGANDQDEPEPSGASHSEYVERDPSQEFLHDQRIIDNARKAGALDDRARPWAGLQVRLIVGVIIGALLSFRYTTRPGADGYWPNPRGWSIGFMLASALVCGFVGEFVWRLLRRSSKFFGPSD